MVHDRKRKVPEMDDRHSEPEFTFRRRNDYVTGMGNCVATRWLSADLGSKVERVDLNALERRSAVKDGRSEQRVGDNALQR